MNVTLTVGSIYKCDSLDQYIGTLVNMFDPVWRQTVIGCEILDVLRDMYKFNVSYVYDDLDNNITVFGETENGSYEADGIDVFARSMSLRLQLLEHAYPVHATYTWRFGFLLRSPERKFFTTFYSKPFTRPAWNCLYGMALFTSILFYILKRWEYRIVGGGESSFPFELLLIIGAYCQHIPPTDTKLVSRRIAYFIFLLFAYIVYTFYTSNLLSNLVNDKDHGIGLENLADSDFECVIVDYMKLAVSGSHFQHLNHNYSLILNKIVNMRAVSVPDGLEAVRTGQVAILSDYTTIYPYIRKSFTNDEICKLISIDLFSNIKKYFFTAKDFRYKEHFKIGTLRMKEVGILKRIMSVNIEVPQCNGSHDVQTSFTQISGPLTVLIGTYIVSVLILVAERIHFKRNQVWPYVE